MENNAQNLSDEAALNWISQILSQEEFDGEDWELIIKIVKWSGREVNEG